MTARVDVAAVMDTYRVVTVDTGNVTGLFLVEPPVLARDRENNDWAVFSIDVTIWDEQRHAGRTFGYEDIWAHVVNHDPKVSLHMTPADRRAEVENNLADVERAVHLAVVTYLERHSLDQVNEDHEAWFTAHRADPRPIEGVEYRFPTILNPTPVVPPLRARVRYSYLHVTGPYVEARSERPVALVEVLGVNEKVIRTAVGPSLNVAENIAYACELIREMAGTS